MKKHVCFLLALLILLTCITGCSESRQGDTEGAFYKRVAVLFSSLAEVWQTAGGTVGMTVGESVSRGIVPEGTPLADDGAGKSINLELLLAYEPDLVICSQDVPAQRALAPILTDAGIKVCYYRMETYRDYLNVLTDMVTLTKRTDALADALCMTESIEALVKDSDAKGVRYLFVRAGSLPSSVKAKTSEEHFVCSILNDLGCQNVADGAVLASDALSIEAIIKADPNHIFFSVMGSEEAAIKNIQSLLKNEPWCSLRAVVTDCITVLPKALFHYKPNGRFLEAYQMLLNELKEGEVR